MNNDNYDLSLIWTYIWNYVADAHDELNKVPKDLLAPIIKLCLKHLGWNNEIESYLITWGYHSLIRQVKDIKEAV